MIEISGKFVIENKYGWHARPCSKIKRLLESYPNVTLYFEKENSNEERASGNSTYSMLRLGVNYGDTLIFVIQGEEEGRLKELLKELCDLLKSFVRDDEETE